MGEQRGQQRLQAEQPGRQQVGEAVCPHDGQPEDQRQQKQHDRIGGDASGDHPVNAPVDRRIAAGGIRHNAGAQGLCRSHYGGGDCLLQSVAGKAGGLQLCALFGQCGGHGGIRSRVGAQIGGDLPVQAGILL